MKTLTAANPETPILAAEMRALETDLINSGKVSGLALMERAGAGVAAAIAAKWPEETGSAVVLCGPGNNGGDGYVVARLLASAGWTVSVFALGDPARLPADAHANFLRLAESLPARAISKAPIALKDADLVVDAIFGIGLTRGLSDDLGRVLAAVPDNAMRVAIDLPSGYDTDQGLILGQYCFAAELVVTFHKIKPVHVGLSEAGTEVVIVDIGL